MAEKNGVRVKLSAGNYQNVMNALTSHVRYSWQGEAWNDILYSMCAAYSGVLGSERAPLMSIMGSPVWNLGTLIGSDLATWACPSPVAPSLLLVSS